MSKGSRRRDAQIPDHELEDRWAKTFGPRTREVPMQQAPGHLHRAFDCFPSGVLEVTPTETVPHPLAESTHPA